MHALEESDLLSNHQDCRIKRKQQAVKEINGISFDQMTLEYPQLIYKFFGNDSIIAEITISEKQRAVGIQPMLYFCFPISYLEEGQNMLGRLANTKEHGTFVINTNNYEIIIQMIKIFGTLSPSHRCDVIEILALILREE